jgi:DNA-binding MarR family transcriptional regulator
VFKLHCVTGQYGKDEFTIKELAPLFGVTTRTMNRIIEKFEANGYCKIIGKRVIGNSGRPSRIIQLNLG